MTVRRIQSQEVSMGRRMILLLLGEKAGMREDVAAFESVDVFAQSKIVAADVFPIRQQKRREVNFHFALNFNFVGDEVTSLKLSLF
jgi:hypothetical protein